MQSVRLKVYGRVQGVFFRQSTRQRAGELNIKGWARNCDDGTVEIEAEGNEADMKSFIEWCRHGPPHAVVNKVETTEIQSKKFTSFEIRR